MKRVIDNVSIVGTITANSIALQIQVKLGDENNYIFPV